MKDQRSPRLQDVIRRLPPDRIAEARLGEESGLDPNADPIPRVVPGPVLPDGGADRIIDL